MNQSILFYKKINIIKNSVFNFKIPLKKKMTMESINDDEIQILEFIGSQDVVFLCEKKTFSDSKFLLN